MKKKHELIKHAYDNYKAGVKFKNLGSGVLSVSSGTFHLDNDGVRDSNTFAYVLGTENKWAKIIK